MGSTLSSVPFNLFMQDLEVGAIVFAYSKSTIWLRYVEDVFMIKRHEKNVLNKFLDHLNSRHPKIKFAPEIEDN